MKPGYGFSLIICCLGLTSGCGDEFTIVPNGVHEIVAVEACYQAATPMLRITITDPESDPVDIAIRTGAEASSLWVYPGPRGPGMVGLSTSPDGETHLLEWSACPAEPMTCTLPSAVTDLEPEFVESCSCASPPENSAFPAVPLLLYSRDIGGNPAPWTIEIGDFDAESCSR